MKNIFYIVVVVIIAGVAFLLFKPKPSTPTNTQTPQTQTPTQTSTQPSTKSTVSYTDQGFNPKTFTVKVGTTVTFVNQASGRMWVASNPHPTHTDLPEFDELTSVGEGSSYQFTFTKAGSWGYHNHLVPSDSGMIIVQ